MADALAVGTLVDVSGDPMEKLRWVREVGLANVQICPPMPDMLRPEAVAGIRQALDEYGVEATAVFCGFAGERWDSIDAIRQTGGLIPRATRAERMAWFKRVADFARDLGVGTVAVHIGFVPEDRASAEYREIVRAMQDLCDYCGGRGLRIALETGQEAAQVLLNLLTDVGRENLGVNFDTANLLLYDRDDPAEALRALAPYVFGTHVKDGQRPAVQDGRFGEEKPLGQGDVDLRAILRILKDAGYRGTLTIEREISGEQQRRDIVAAKELLEAILREDLAER